MKLILGDCLEELKSISSSSVDMCLTDPPYGSTCQHWDSIIPFDKMWREINRVMKPNGAVLLFATNPYDKLLAVSNIKNYKYDWVWEKEQGTGQLNAKKQPLRKHEYILVFYKNQPTYNPQFSEGKPYHIKRDINTEGLLLYNGINKESETISDGKRYPVSVLNYNRELKNRYHPTQKPVALLEYLIRTYSNESETVLDFAMGSGSGGVACVNTNRNFIGIEKDEKYFNIAKERIENGHL